jgi:hypothetical protein
MSETELVRYIPLDGALDPDPIATQPARDAFGPILTSKGGHVRIWTREVDAAGRPIAPTGETYTILIVIWNQVELDATPSGPIAPPLPPLRWGSWSRGPEATSVLAGEYLIQEEIDRAVSFQVVVTARSNPTAGAYLAVLAELDQVA